MMNKLSERILGIREAVRAINDPATDTEDKFAEIVKALEEIADAFDLLQDALVSLGRV